MPELPQRYDVWNCADSLAFLAAEVAVDLDNAFLGRVADYSSAKKLAEILKNEAQARDISPCTIPILSQALKDYKPMSGRREKITQASELSTYLTLVSQELEKTETLSKERLEILAEFCVDLSRTTIAFQQGKYRRHLAA